MRKEQGEKAELDALKKIFWETKDFSAFVVKEDETTKSMVMPETGEIKKEKYNVWVFSNGGIEVLKIEQSKTNKDNIFLTIGGKPKNWSKEHLEHVLTDIRTLQKTINNLQKEISAQEYQKFDKQHPGDTDASTMAFLSSMIKPERI